MSRYNSKQLTVHGMVTSTDSACGAGLNHLYVVIKQILDVLEYG